MKDSVVNENTESRLDGQSENRLKLAELRAANHDGFDPVRFRYMESLSLKATQQTNPRIRALLEARVATALVAYLDEFSVAETKARKSLNRIKQNPDALESDVKRAELCFQICDFKALYRLELALMQLGSGTANKTFRQGMPSLVAQHPAVLEKSLQGLSFDDYLRQQEDDLLASEVSQGSGTAHFAELKSLRLFRDSWVKLNADKVVTQAIKEAPENAGPLNSHRLVIRSLSAIRELSPAYLNRFVSYLDTLLWLEQVGEETHLLPPKKTPAKPGRR